MIDSNEKAPLPFPSTIRLHTSGNRQLIYPIVTLRRPLPFGDYCLLNYAHLACVERKGSIREVTNNCLTADRTRFLAAHSRLLHNCAHPFFLLEGSPRKYLTPTKEVPTPGPSLDNLFHLLQGIPFLFFDTTTPASRLLAGELVARILVANSLGAPHGLDHKNPESPRG